MKLNSIDKWKQSLLQNKKALLYKSIKFDFFTEPYIFRVHNKINRSLLARLRAGCLDLEIEIGRWHGIERGKRICKLCSDGIEDEVHFLFRCSKLEHIREYYLNTIEIDYETQCDNDRFRLLCSNNSVLTLSKMVRRLYDERKLILYN